FYNHRIGHQAPAERGGVPFAPDRGPRPAAMTPEEVAELRQRRYNGTVVYLRKTHSDLMVLRVKPDFPRPPHKPGQYCSLGLGYWEPRVEGCQEETLPPE